MWVWCCWCVLSLLSSVGLQPGFTQATTPLLSCRLAAPTLQLGTQTELFLEIQNIENFYNYELTLNYDPNLVELLDSDPNLPEVNAQLGDFLTPDFVTINEVGQPGQLFLNVMQGEPTPARTGSGLLARGQLLARQIGTVNFTLSEVSLAGGDGLEILPEIRGCTLQITSDPVPTTAITPTATVTSLPTATLPSETPTATPTPPLAETATATTSTLPTASTEQTATATAFPAPTTEPTFSPTSLPPPAEVAPGEATPTPTVVIIDPALQPTALPLDATGGEVPVPTLAGETTNPPVLAVTPPLDTPAPNQVVTNVITNPVQVTVIITGSEIGAAPTAAPQPILSAAQLEQNRQALREPSAPFDLYLVILLVGVVAVGFTGMAFVILLIYVLVLRVRLSPPASLDHPLRRPRRGRRP